jgi:hypothetical protein
MSAGDGKLFLHSNERTEETPGSSRFIGARVNVFTPSAWYSNCSLKKHRTAKETLKETLMLVELSIIPIGHNTHMSAELAKALQLIDASGLPYQLTPSGAVLRENGMRLWRSSVSVMNACVKTRRMWSP